MFIYSLSLPPALMLETAIQTESSPTKISDRVTPNPMLSPLFKIHKSPPSMLLHFSNNVFKNLIYFLHKPGQGETQGLCYICTMTVSKRSPLP